MRDMTSVLIRVAVIAGICILFLAGLLVFMNEQAPEETPAVKVKMKN